MNGTGMRKRSLEVLLPFSLTAVILLIDQVTKALVVARIGMDRVGWSFLDGFLRIVHRRNPGIAFSVGVGLPEPVRNVLFLLVPIGLVVVLLWYSVTTHELSTVQRWAVAAIIGGGAGNLVDRLFRPEGVVDFIDVRIFGLLGMERWPTFNAADSSVVLGSLVLMATFIFKRKETT